MSSLLNVALNISDRLVTFAVTIPSTQLIFGKPSLYLILSLYAAMLLLFVAWEKDTKGWIWSVAGIFLLLTFQYYQWDLDSGGRVTVIDVGQGDNILIELPYRKGVYLIDTGGSVPFEREPWQKKRKPFEVGERIVVPFLQVRGIHQIDKLIITHGDYDHAGAAETILSHIRVKELVIGEKNPLDELEENLISQALSKEIKVTSAAKGDKWRKGEFSFHILSPAGNEKTKNDQSLVLYTELGGVTWLFTGDLEMEGEEQLVKNFPFLKTDILKAGHHGSKTSTSPLLLDHLGYHLCGKKQSLSAPSCLCHKRIKKRGIIIFRTDKHGAISYRFLQNKGTFHWQIP